MKVHSCHVGQFTSIDVTLNEPQTHINLRIDLGSKYEEAEIDLTIDEARTLARRILDATKGMIY